MIQFTAITKKSDGSWEYTWEDLGDGPWRVVLLGTTLDKVSTPTYNYVFNGYGTYPPPLEIVPAAELADSERYNTRVRFQWYRVSGAVAYLVERYVSGAWVQYKELDGQNEQWVYEYRTEVVANGTEVRARVKALDFLENESTPLEFEKTVVCPPRPPDGEVSVSYNSLQIQFAAV